MNNKDVLPERRHTLQRKPGTTRRKTLQALGGLAALALLPAAVPLARAAAWEGKALRIGYQKSSTLTVLLKTRGSLERRLAPLGLKVEWYEFTSGLPLLEALNIGSLEFSADVADTVPVFAQAAGARLTYVAQETPSPAAQAIVVPEASPIRSLADLKGRKIGLAKGAGAHYLLIAALASVGLTVKDVEVAYLPPADGRAAFERGAIDAWSIWDPFLAGVQRQSKVRLLTGEPAVAQYKRYYLAADAFAEARPDVLAVLFEELREVGRWVKASPKEAAALLSPVWGLDADTVELANSRRSYELRAVTPDQLGEQQRIADAFFAEKLLPKKVVATEVRIWTPG
ncbi:aliphatic sulfonate ABC transporter substrate-binding protein [Azoarcus indigens]|uniref:Putative aliphatic sulfonates-binding protein n=1 Tax=Azoarcus indigens TaxID=29545 RepID=A0A4R6DRL1_9RHOO|nr:aliphatic sulfonate ABC transporter substrate-binding protein [Azoarcus indigens]NMG65850.1 aliphatic sulfonate ABC transporter substrate-binding protein [Azoarcus indigens]TDN47700.1 sulfonate transport system substrate-binding protein [Azoarcus indigens]